MFQTASAAFEDWAWHLRQLRDDRKEQLLTNPGDRETDLLGQSIYYIFER